MTQEREEQLIADTSETKAMLKRLIEEFDNQRNTYATVESVHEISGKLRSHISSHKWGIGTMIGAVGGFSGVISAIAMWLQVYKK